jgi:hypothetical protein
LPNDEYPETHTHKNQNKNIQRCRVKIHYIRAP